MGLFVLGTALRMQRKYDDSHALFEQTVAMYEELGDLDRASGARGNIGNLLQEQGRLDDAIAIYRKDLRQYPSTTHPYPAAGTLSNLGAVLVKAGRPGEGVTQLLKALGLRRRLGGKPGLASTLRNLGAAYIALSEISRDTGAARKAVAALTEARQISISMVDAQGCADGANNLAVALCSLWEFEKGIALFDEALEYFDQTGQVDQATRTRWHRDRARQAAGILVNTSRVISTERPGITKDAPVTGHTYTSAAGSRSESSHPVCAAPTSSRSGDTSTPSCCRGRAAPGRPR